MVAERYRAAIYITDTDTGGDKFEDKRRVNKSVLTLNAKLFKLQSTSYILYAAFFSSHQSSSLIAALNCDVEGRHFCAVCPCRFVRVGRIWVYDLQSSKVGEEGKKKEDQAIKARSE
ncbi:hypothetical protein T05_1449 [Trichinella murrelli]|uniref:Uncharacterized protein n=1 Tax=Trichinella murrelli TaxID=144512 RepID=A0A0V0UGD6_9BILA|nr:hypothetical protein T05_1449 [Trichinella murrelli]